MKFHGNSALFPRDLRPAPRRSNTKQPDSLLVSAICARELALENHVKAAATNIRRLPMAQTGTVHLPCSVFVRSAKDDEEEEREGHLIYVRTCPVPSTRYL